MAQLIRIHLPGANRVIIWTCRWSGDITNNGARGITPQHIPRIMHAIDMCFAEVRYSLVLPISSISYFTGTGAILRLPYAGQITLNNADHAWVEFTRTNNTTTTKSKYFVGCHGFSRDNLSPGDHKCKRGIRNRYDYVDLFKNVYIKCPQQAHLTNLIMHYAHIPQCTIL